jgi:hypothetical protein
MRQNVRVTLTSLFLASIFLCGSAVRCQAATAGATAHSPVQQRATAADWLGALAAVLRLEVSPAIAFAPSPNGHISNIGNHFRAKAGARRPARFGLDQGCGINPDGSCCGGH